MLTCIHPFYTGNHPAEIVNIYTSKISNKDVNVDKSFQIASEKILNIDQILSILQKSVRVNDKEIIGTSFIYSIVIAMQLQNVAVTVENIFEHELALKPTYIFNDDSDLISAKSKTYLKRTLKSKTSTCTMSKAELAIIDGSAVL